MEFTPDASALPVSVPPPVDVPPFRDRGTGLAIFGVIQILLAVGVALFIPFILFSAFISTRVPGGVAMRPGHYVSAIAVYALIAASFAALGIGSVQARRWARALTLVFSWYGLVFGIFMTILLTAILPVTMRIAMRAQQKSAGTPPPELSTGVMAVIVTLIIVFAAFFLIIVPIAFVIFYSREDVEETCRRRDPVERWTDRVPLPVLGAAAVFGAGAVYFLMFGLSTPVFPFFGRYLTGIPGVAGMLVLSALDCYLAIAIFRLKPLGWWLAVISLAVRFLSMALTYRGVSLLQAYSKLGMSDSQLQVMNANPIFRSQVMQWWALLCMLPFLGYLFWVKKYFRKSESPTEGSANPSLQSPSVLGLNS